ERGARLEEPEDLVVDVVDALPEAAQCHGGTIVSAMPGGDSPIKPFTERKQAFAEREVAKGKGLFGGSEPRGTGPQNRHGMPQLPVGQRRVPNWPVLD